MIKYTLRLDTNLNNKLDNICNVLNISKKSFIMSILVFYFNDFKKIKLNNNKFNYKINSTYRLLFIMSPTIDNLLLEKSTQLNISKNLLINLLVNDFINNFSLV
ncbi:hypothetical protein STFE110948_02895 [Streptobacillus felis]|uniref:hypothetical protein n=1 Tax=Streptobacillus felis TaxID=1384509 RepID=UPI00082CA74E|nr:hypothetical protein [Streptobacillus felis]